MRPSLRPRRPNRTSASPLVRRAMRVALVACLLGGFLGSLFGCRTDRARPLTIYCASSVLTVIEQVAEKLGDTPPIVVHGASSSTLSRQISAGAHADIFISAHRDWLRSLATEGRVDLQAAVAIAHNTLVIAARHDGPLGVPDDPVRFATGDPAHVPLGIYARQALESRGVWDAWEEKLLPAVDARAAVEYLRRGEADLAILYRTDVIANPELRILEEIPALSHDPIELIAAPVAGAQEGTDALLAELTKAQGRARLGAAGFRLGPAPRRETSTSRTSSTTIGGER